MTSANLQQWISHPECLNRETLYELRILLMRFPYCQLFRLLYLKNLYLLHDITFGAELRKAALYIPDLKVLFYLIEGDKYTLSPVEQGFPQANESEENEGLDRTLSLIDSFLAKVPQEELSFTTDLEYITDYTTYLVQDDLLPETETKQEAPRLNGQELIDGFIAKAETDSIMKFRSLEDELEKEVERPEIFLFDDTEDDSYFTETLAKIYIKQHRYSKALEIIKKLSLKYPKKNAYFADQIRFLEKLIINANSK
ncbi:MAG: tetratricopeptide repeat protein [Bacteroides sp.]|nr:tetratricopeptide repeat protein [Bacteroides sp.]